MGWGVSSNPAHNAATSDASKVYTYDGSPTRYSLGVDPDQRAQGIEAPAPASAGVTAGWVQVAILSEAAAGYETGFKPVIRVTSTGTSRYIEINHLPDGSLQLFMDGTNKAATDPLDFSTWKVVALQWDMSADPWKARIWVDGVAATAEFTDSAPAATGTSLIVGGVGPDTNAISYWLAQVIVWDDYADDGATPQYVTRVDATADGTSVGTWTPSTGSDDFAVVGSPFDAATYTEEAAPSALDRVEVVTSTLSTALGVTPSSVAAVTAHTYSEGQAITARAVVGDGGAGETSGTTTAISPTTTTYAYATATAAPTSAAAWTGTDAVDLVYEVVTV
jgi:hypothetical protein